MPPRKSTTTDRKQPTRKSTKSGIQISDDAIARRVKRYLDDLERVNYAKHQGEDDGGERLAVSEAKRGGRAAAGAKRSTMGVRQLLLYRKNLATLIDESGIRDLPPDVPTYLTAAAPPPPEPALRFCVACGYWGKYRCEKCGDDYCSVKCNEWHAEHRCGKL